jgi:hypothetical protein
MALSAWCWRPYPRAAVSHRADDFTTDGVRVNSPIATRRHGWQRGVELVLSSSFMVPLQMVQRVDGMLTPMEYGTPATWEWRAFLARWIRPG